MSNTVYNSPEGVKEPYRVCCNEHVPWHQCADTMQNERHINKVVPETDTVLKLTLLAPSYLIFIYPNGILRALMSNTVDVMCFY